MVGLRVLLAEPWWAGSHRAWAEGYQRHSRHDVSVVHLSPSGWRWRLRAGAVPMAELVHRWVLENGAPDVLLVSGLIDVAQLVGMTRRAIGDRTAVVIYQHESQIVYRPDRADADDEAVLRNWQSWCAADRVVFNSEFHRRSARSAMGPFLARQVEDDQQHLLDIVFARSEVVAVGIDPVERAGGPDRRVPRVLWPHRWEPDKDPAAFASALRRLRDSGLECRLVLAGEDGPAAAPDFRTEVAAEFADWVDAVGPFSTEGYRRWVGQSDIVVSCARHELFGVAVAEAMSAGCRPVLPDGLSYPDLVGPEHHHLLYPPKTFGSALEAAVAEHQTAKPVPSLVERMREFAWPAQAAALDAVLAIPSTSSPIGQTGQRARHVRW